MYRDWTESVIHLTGCRIVPAATYEIESLRRFDDVVSGAYSTPLVALTIKKSGAKYWGDTVGFFNGTEWTPPQETVNIDDAVAAIKTWQQATGAPHVTRTDVEPVVPNGITNFNEVSIILAAFRGDPYPFEDPTQCPPAKAGRIRCAILETAPVVRRDRATFVELVIFGGNKTKSGSRDDPPTRSRTPDCAVSPIPPCKLLKSSYRLEQ